MVAAIDACGPVSPSKGLIEKENQIIYYQINLEKKNTQYELEKQAVLGSLGVQVESISANNYLEGYKKIANHVRDSWAS